MLETEYKCMLDEKTYDAVKSAFNWDEVKEQTNSYYTDSRNELKKHGITLRVRTIDSVHKIQVKAHKNADSPLQICEETEYEIDNIPEKFSKKDVKRMTGIETEAMLLGDLTTLRHSSFEYEGAEICLDKSVYLDRSDYELEVEYTDQMPQALVERLKDCGVEFTGTAVGKCSRFMLRLAEILSGKE